MTGSPCWARRVTPRPRNRSGSTDGATRPILGIPPRPPTSNGWAGASIQRTRKAGQKAGRTLGFVRWPGVVYTPEPSVGPWWSDGCVRSQQGGQQDERQESSGLCRCGGSRRHARGRSPVRRGGQEGRRQDREVLRSQLVQGPRRVRLRRWQPCVCRQERMQGQGLGEGE